MRSLMVAMIVVALAGCSSDDTADPHACGAPVVQVEGQLYGSAVVCDWGGTCNHEGKEIPCLCRGASECGAGFQCIRGAGCFCSCAADGALPAASCADPTCENVEVNTTDGTG